MGEITLKVPEDIKDFIDDTSETIYVEALKEVCRRRMSYTKKRLRDLMKKIAGYETKYGQPYEEFLKNVPDSMKGHDDWIEWSYLVKVADELTKKIEKFKLIAGK